MQVRQNAQIFKKAKWCACSKNAKRARKAPRQNARGAQRTLFAGARCVRVPKAGNAQRKAARARAYAHAKTAQQQCVRQE